ncbi:SLBB domain-containing protein [Pseudomonas sp.]|uniref:SLBB domain-containing protein n=1 Tax=Pseudomonas sp. TaxID=306 RepID=UPI0037CCAC47
MSSLGSYGDEALTLRPGDIIQLSLPGEPAFSDPFTVERDGNLLLPELGRVPVEGLSEAQARDLLLKKLGVVYRDLNRFDLQLKERQLPITVLGYVRKPGPVTLQALGNIQMALAAADGLVPGAQIDKLQLRRGSEVFAVDYKKYLDSGDANLLPALQPRDLIFVPASPLIGNVQIEFDAATLSAGGDAGESQQAVRVFGEVNNPGSYSIKPGNTVVDMLMRAGGVTRYAGVERIRVITQGAPQLFDLKAYLDSGDASRLVDLNGGATIFVPIQEEAVSRNASTVYIMGEVFRPGAYESQQGTSFFDILANAGGPTRFAESRQIRILRIDGQVESFDLQAYTEGLVKAAQPQIRPGDAIFVPEKTDMNEKSWLKVAPNRAVMVMGQVTQPGRFEWSDEMSLLDLLAHAGGPTAQADIANVQIVAPGGKPSVFDLSGFLSEGGSLQSLPQIRAGFTIMVPDLPQDPSNNKSQWVRQASENSIYIFGQVGAPGRYAFNPQLSFIDILSAADGPTAAADIHNIRVTHRNESRPRVTQLDLADYFETGDENLLPRVVPGDSIYVPEKNRPWLDEKKENMVRVIGAVAKPGRYRFNDEMTILDLLAEAGGPTATAYLKNIVVVNVAKAQAGQDQARSFNFATFVRKPDFSQLPLVRPGDTVYVPDSTASNWAVFMKGVTDTVSILSIFAITGGL